MDRMPEAVADGLGSLLQRGVRSRLHAEVVRDVHPAVTAVSYPIISGVARFGPITATDLGQELGLDRSFVSRHGALLARAGLVAAARDPGDARASRLALTPAGEEVVRRLRHRLQAAIGERLRDWSADDRRRLAELLPRFADALADATVEH